MLLFCSPVPLHWQFLQRAGHPRLEKYYRRVSCKIPLALIPLVLAHVQVLFFSDFSLFRGDQIDVQVLFVQVLFCASTFFPLKNQFLGMFFQNFRLRRYFWAPAAIFGAPAAHFGRLRRIFVEKKSKKNERKIFKKKIEKQIKKMLTWKTYFYRVI